MSFVSFAANGISWYYKKKKCCKISKCVQATNTANNDELVDIWWLDILTVFNG
jgi:hypothetical protein